MALPPWLQEIVNWTWPPGLVVLLIWCVKLLIDRSVKLWSAKSLANHKADLKKQHDRELVEMKAAIEKTAFEHHIQFERFHYMVAKVITSLFAKLAKVQHQCLVLTSPSSPDENKYLQDQLETTIEVLSDFQRYYEEHSVFFDEAMCAKIDEFTREASKAITERRMFNWSDEVLKHSPDLRRGKLEGWIKSRNIMNERIPPIMRKIKSQFRVLLGVSEDAPIGTETKDSK